MLFHTTIVGRRVIRTIVGSLVVAALAATASGAPIALGDVFVSFTKQGSGYVRHYNSAMIQLGADIPTGGGFYPNGMAFDGNGDLYVTNLNDNFITRISRTTGAAMSPWNTGVYAAEDMLFDGACNAWVGSTIAGIYKFDSKGSPLGTYLPSRRVDWFDLAADQTTMLYTHEGQGDDYVHQANVSGAPPGTPGAPLVTSPSADIRYAVKILPNGDALVTERAQISRYTGSTLSQSYDAPGHDGWFGMCLGVGGTSLWAVDIGQQDVVNIDLNTGTPQVYSLNDNTIFMGSVIVAGGYSAAASVGCIIAVQKRTWSEIKTLYR